MPTYDGPGDLLKLRADLTGLAAAAGPLAALAVRKTCADVTADAQAAAPVDTGDLRRSISYDVTATATTATGEVGPTVDYGGYVEFGTSRMGPQPYLTPAFDRRTPALDAALAMITDRFGRG